MRCLSFVSASRWNILKIFSEMQNFLKGYNAMRSLQLLFFPVYKCQPNHRSNIKLCSELMGR